MIEYLVLGDAIDTTGISLPLDVTDGIELTLGDVDMATALRKPLRDRERSHQTVTAKGQFVLDASGQIAMAANQFIPR